MWLHSRYIMYIEYMATLTEMAKTEEIGWNSTAKHFRTINV